MRHFLAYAEFEPFWQRFRPLTPFGREVHERRELLTDAAPLVSLWDRTGAALELLEGLDDFQASRLSHHLKRLPRFTSEPRAVYDEVEIFQVKKFLHNYRCLVERLPASTLEVFGLVWSSEALEEHLAVGWQSAEAFYVSDEYSEELSRVRAEIRRVDQALTETRSQQAAEIEATWGLAFGAREFLVVPRARLAGPSGAVELDRAGELLRVEAYDPQHYLVHPRVRAEEMLLGEQRTALEGLERAAEDQVLREVSGRVRAELPVLVRYREAVRAFDLALAGARLAREHGLCRPTLVSEGPVRIRGGRFVPCEENCRRLGTRYQPLEASFDTSTTVLFGSNMGGKTVVLKTLAFLQTCAQMGLYVPAQSFTTRVFQRFHYVGEGCDRGPTQGLSGFGFEVRQFQEVWKDLDRPTLALFDEFARTTHSREAEALISAALEALAGKPGLVALFSTHFRGVRRFPGVRYQRMKGLNRQDLDFDQTLGADLDQRIRLIDNHMDYLLVPDEGIPRNSDALAVAALLGVDPALIGRAERFFLEGN